MQRLVLQDKFITREEVAKERDGTVVESLVHFEGCVMWATCATG